MVKDLAESSEAPTTSDSEIYFCRNPGGLATMSLRSLAKEKLDAIRSLHRREDSRGIVRILVFFALWAVAAYAALTSGLLVVQVLSGLAIVCALVGCTVLLHEASHRLLFRRPVLNEWVGFICGLPVILSVSGFRTNHLAHHDRRGSTVDLADVGANFRDSTSSALVYYFSILIRAYGFLVYLPFIGLTKGNWRMRAKSLIEYASIAAGGAIVFQLFSTEVVLKLWIVPLLVSALLTELRAVAEHGLTTRGNVFTATRTVVSNRLVSFIMCNINYHLEHHLFPGVPWYNLPKVHRLLREDYLRAGCSVYRSYTEFFIDFFKASWSGIVPNARLIPEETRKAAVYSRNDEAQTPC